jgi:hypothetical protein
LNVGPKVWRCQIGVKRVFAEVCAHRITCPFASSLAQQVADANKSCTDCKQLHHLHCAAERVIRVRNPSRLVAPLAQPITPESRARRSQSRALVGPRRGHNSPSGKAVSSRSCPALPVRACATIPPAAVAPLSSWIGGDVNEKRVRDAGSLGDAHYRPRDATPDHARPHAVRGLLRAKVSRSVPS